MPIRPIQTARLREDSMIDRVGQKLGNYRLLRLLGRGGSASVYLGEHVYLKSHAALKILHTQLTDQDASRFVTEAQTLARLSHPHIVERSRVCFCHTSCRLSTSGRSLPPFPDGTHGTGAGSALFR